jgi:hypothetical protein
LDVTVDLQRRQQPPVSDYVSDHSIMMVSIKTTEKAAAAWRHKLLVNLTKHSPQTFGAEYTRYTYTTVVVLNYS